LQLAGAFIALIAIIFIKYNAFLVLSDFSYPKAISGTNIGVNTHSKLDLQVFTVN
jgi:hypothetical protein